MKIFSWLVILAGLTLIFTGAYNIYQSNAGQSAAMEQARSVVEDNGNTSENSQNEVSDDEATPQSFDPDIGDTIGILEIPALEAELPIIEGADENELDRGVGHYRGSGFAGEERQMVLSGHRDTVFRDLGELEEGDSFYVQMPYGEYRYDITDMYIVDADDTSVIDLETDEEHLIVSTCYPFRMVGNAPERYVIKALPAD